jgi:glucose-6-phosphate 1-dehydrogenase
MTTLRPTDILIFGGNGDLALRKILPALFYRHADKQLPKGRIIGLGRTHYTDKQYQALAKKSCKAYGDKAVFSEARWNAFVKRLEYVTLDALNPADYAELASRISEKKAEQCVYYLAVSADIFGEICKQLSAHKLITDKTRIVLEKPLGRDLASFEKIDREVLSYFDEKQIYRIDHYLGKETVQNLMIIRFANAMFERIWNADAIHHVDITVSESLGVEGRAGFYDEFGALRDMVQNHLLQLLCLVAMDPPNRVDSTLVRREKLKVLEALRPITGSDVKLHTVRGQYGSGSIAGKKVGSYKEDIGHASGTETYVAIRAFVDNWRWSGVPFYLKTGKRLKTRYSEIVIHFNHVPHQIFAEQPTGPEGNKLVIRIQPDESVRMRIMTKVPGPGGYRLKPVELNLSLDEAHEERSPEAYERLLMDVIRGNPTLFMHSDEVRAAWKWTDGIIKGWEKLNMKPVVYPAGSEGVRKRFVKIEQ